MTDPLLPAGLLVTAEHCGRPLTWRGSGVRWVGIEEHSERRLRCDICRLAVTILTMDLDPIPSEQETRS